ncbi:MAG TPA: TIGR03435 family protein [Acidobacteriaceae bacterium]|nr:TIGR03435 family protein [Acidobacteriaceae bacterium]
MITQRSGFLHGRALCALILAALCGTAASVVAPAQQPVSANVPVRAPIDAVPPKISFDIVSFKRCPPGKAGTTKVDLPMTGDYLAYHCEPLSRIIYFAYYGATKVYSLDGVPPWVDDDHYEFIVKVAPEDFPVWNKLDLPARRLVIRTVLADAVKLKVHVDYTPKAVYALTAMKKVHLTPYQPGDQTKLPDGQVQSGRSHNSVSHISYFQGFTMAELAEVLGANMDRGVVDHTNLDGRFNFAMPFSGSNNNPDSHQGGPDAPTLEDGLEQLGLRLATAKAPVERLMIDHIEKPAED